MKKSLLMAAIMSSCFVSAPTVADTNYPNHSINLVIGFSAGGATDILGRILAKGMSEELGQSVVVENRPGAGGNIGAEYLARSKKDGYTLFMATIGNAAINPFLYKKLSYDYQQDFQNLGLVAYINNVLVVNGKSEMQSVDDYLQAAKNNPGDVTCASAGIGSTIHLSCELFKVVTKTDILHVPYKGSGPAVTDLMGGRVDSMFDNIPSSAPHVKEGKFKALAVAGEERSKQLPDVPTFKELGYDEIVVDTWFSLVAPKGTDEAIVKKINKALNNTLAKDEIKAAFEKNGFSINPDLNTPEKMDEFVDSEINKWKEVISKADISLD